MCTAVSMRNPSTPHVDVLVVGLDQVLLHLGVLGVEVGEVLMDPAAARVLALPVADPALVIEVGGEHAGRRTRPLALVGRPALGVRAHRFAPPVLAGAVGRLLRRPSVAVVGIAVGILLERVVLLALHRIVVVILPVLVLDAVRGRCEEAFGTPPSGAVVVHDVLVDLDPPLGVRLVDELLVGDAIGLQAGGRSRRSRSRDIRGSRSRSGSGRQGG